MNTARAGGLLVSVLVGAALVGAARLVPAPSALVTLSIGSTGTPISPTAVNGFNVPYDMSVAEAQGAVQSVAPTSLRYPPGNVGDEQDLTRAGLVSFQSTLRLSGPQTLATIETRVFSTRPDAGNRPQDAARAARDAAALGLKPLYWEIGNEPDLYGSSRGDPSWTPQRYCQTFRAQRAAILGIDPAAKFAGPAVSNVEGGGLAFLEAFVRSCGDAVDLLTWHEYPTRGDQTDEAALATASRVTAHLNRFRALLADPATNPHGSGRPALLGVTEYSLSYVSGRTRHLSDMVAALWAAETTLRLAEGGASLAQYFALIGSGGHGLVDLAGFPRPSLYAFQMTRFFRGEALAASSSDPALWVHAARDHRALSVLVSNTATAPRMLASAVPGYTLTGAKTFTAQVTDDGADPIRLRLDPALTLPARSMTRLTYKQLASP